MSASKEPLANANDLRDRLVVALTSPPLPATDLGGHGDTFRINEGGAMLAKLNALVMSNQWLARTGGRHVCTPGTDVKNTDWSDVVEYLHVIDVVRANAMAGPYEVGVIFNN